MKSFLFAAIAAAGAAMTGVAGANEALAKKEGCLTCHAVDKNKMGPGLKEISAKYKGKKGAEAAIVAKLKAGKEHPAVKSSDADLAALSKWILSL